MDPNACLAAAENAMDRAEKPGDSTLHVEEVENHLADYREWRRNGGFAADNGEDRERSLRNRLLTLGV